MIVSEPTDRAVVAIVAVQVPGVPVAVAGKVAVPSVTPPLTNETVEVGQTPLTAVMVSVKTTGAPYVSPVAGEAVSAAVGETTPTVSVAVALPEP